MPWVRLDDRFPRHSKVTTLRARSVCLHVEALCWSAENLTDGAILATQVQKITRLSKDSCAAAVVDLVQAGLWDVVPGGWVIHDYLDYNPSRAKVRQDRDATRTRVARWRESRNGPGNAVTGTVTEEVGNGDVTPPPAPTPTTTTKTPPVGPPSKPAAATSASSRGTRLPDDWTPDEELSSWTLRAGLTAETARYELEKFRDYWHGLSGTRAVKKDWGATWRNWVRKASEQRSRNGSESHYERNRRILRATAVNADHSSVVELFGRKEIE